MIAASTVGRTVVSRPWLLFALVALLAVLARLAFDLFAADRFADLSNDARSYRSIAENLVAGVGFVDEQHPQPGSITRPPLTPLFLALLLSLGGDSLVIERTVNAFLGGLATVATVLVARQWFGPLAGALAGVLVAVYPFLLVLSATSLSENLGIPLGVLAVLAAQRLSTTLSGRDATLAGLAVGLSVLNRSAMAVLLLAQLILLVQRRGWAGVRPWLWSLVVSGLVVLPWSIYASATNGRFILVDTQGPLVLYIGNNPSFQSSTLWQFHLGKPGTTLAPEAAEPLHGLQGAELDRRALELALAFFRERPGDVVVLALQKGLLFWGWYPHPIDVVATVGTLLLALVGLASSLARWRDLLLPLSLVFLLTTLHAFTTALPRHRMTVMPLVLAFSAHGTVELGRFLVLSLRNQRRGPAARSLNG